MPRLARDRTLARRNPLLAAWQTYAAAQRSPFGTTVTEAHDRLRELREDPERYLLGFRPFARAWQMRHRACWRWSFAVPTDAALAAIAAYSPIVEIGAGSGYWAHLLRRDYGADIVAYDRRPPGVSRHPCYRRSYSAVLQGGARKAKQFSDRALFLCWPPYAEPMAHQCLTQYRGRTVIYIGEDQGGCNATPAFFDTLDAAFTLTHTLDLPQWEGIHDRLTIWTR